jgi:hypothetical protein
MNWGKLAGLLLQLALMAVPMVEEIAGDAKKGSAKKDLALKAIDRAATVAETISPENAGIAQIAAATAGQVIDAVVTIGNATGDLKKSTVTAAPAAPQSAQPQPQVSGLG